MNKLWPVVAVSLLLVPQILGQGADGQFKIALPKHKGQLRWTAQGFTVVQSSAKPNGNEIGLRGRDRDGRVGFLGFLFLFSDQAPLTSLKCRDGVMNPEKKEDRSLKVVSTSEESRGTGLPVALVTYTTENHGKASYMVRGFVANADICGDLEFYSNAPLSLDDSAVKDAFAAYQLDENYVAQFKDVLLYAQILYDSHAYKAAAPLYEEALAKLREHPEGDASAMTRVLTDQAGMSYGISGNTAKARAIFDQAIISDPGYPLYYYNLACADAADKNLAGAQENLQKAFDRKANVIAGEHMPDPTQDDSFLPYRNNKEFWAFVKSLQSKP